MMTKKEPCLQKIVLIHKFQNWKERSDRRKMISVFGHIFFYKLKIEHIP